MGVSGLKNIGGSGSHVDRARDYLADSLADCKTMGALLDSLHKKLKWIIEEAEKRGEANATSKSIRQLSFLKHTITEKYPDHSGQPELLEPVNCTRLTWMTLQDKASRMDRITRLANDLESDVGFLDHDDAGHPFLADV